MGLVDRVWLYHGTTAAAAAGFIARGWAPEDPVEAITRYAAGVGVDPAALLDGFTTHGAERRAAGEMSCATGWKLAASYARNGPEYLYFARTALERLRRGGDSMYAPPPFEEDVSVLAFHIPWSEMPGLVAYSNPPPRESILPDPRVWSDLDLLDQMKRVAAEVVVQGSRMRPFLARVDRVRPVCDCIPQLSLGSGAPDDPRISCDRCVVLSSAPPVGSSVSTLP